ncbi:MAG: GTP 3',8-cyclase MoaA [Bradymonadaceae bacterium]|nr:GTP 3',8-cyclase MoaA [Lujinxingiaceae bacterium]
MKQLIDRFGRVHNAMRISVTDKCNLRCHYCMPVTGVACAPREQLLSFEQIVATVRVANRLGIDRIRVTGGEPLLRRELPALIGMLKRETDSTNVSLTTNALLLERHAEALAEAGLDRVNVSLDSLRPDRFEKITRHGVLETVWRGIEAATRVGLAPIKINTLLLSGFNDDEIDDWIELTMQHDISVRFMELMPIGEGAKMGDIGGYLNLTELKDRLVETRGLVALGGDGGNGPACYYGVPGAKGKLGFITPLSNKYCGTCSRMRLTSTGELRACLAFDKHVDISEAIRRGDEEGIEAGFVRAIGEKPAGHNWENGQVTRIGMSTLGG